MGRSIVANEHAGILLFGNLCLINECVVSLFLTCVPYWDFKAVCTEYLSPLHVLFFYLQLPFLLLDFIHRIDLFS